MVASAGSAWAAGDDLWGAVDCDQVAYAGCELAAGRTAAIAENGPAAGATARSLPVAQDPEVWSVHCSYERTDFQLPPGGSGAEGTGAAELEGAWYMYRCPGADHADTLRIGPMWLPDAPTPDGGTQVSPAALAEAAYTQLRLPTPAIRSNPAGPHLVNLPTWLWVDESTWGSRSATASVPGVSVTATATPTRVVWSMGDGTSFSCAGPGTPFPAGGDPAAGSPDCGHVYRSSSAAEPDQVFVVGATVYWTVRWSGAGQRGTFGELSTSDSTRLRVVEVAGLNTGPG